MPLLIPNLQLLLPDSLIQKHNNSLYYVSEHILHLPPVLRLLLFLYSLTTGPIPNPTFGFWRACFSGPSLDPLYARARCIQYILLPFISGIYTTCTVILGLFGLCMTRTNRHLLCAYCFTSYAYYIYVAVPIQQGTHITNLFNILLLRYYYVLHIRITWLY